LNFQHLATIRPTAISLCVAPGPRRLEIFMNRDPRIALSQELEAKQALLDQLRALARSPADALGVKQELEKALEPDGKPTT
jgi:hypothetical protein